MSVETARDWFGYPVGDDLGSRLARYYDLTYADRDGDVDWCRALVSRLGGPILELGCGTGRVAVPLATDGHTVVGLDRSAAMLDRARERAREAGVDARFVEGDIRAFSLQESFPLIAMVFNTFLMLDPADRMACLARVREHLAPRGHFAMHVFQPDPERIVGQDGAFVDEGSYEDGGSRVSLFTSARATVDRTTVTWRYDEVAPDGALRRTERTTTLHFLYRRELEMLFSSAGFAIETMYGDFDGAPVDEHSPELLVVARRRERGEGERRRP